MKGTGYSRNLLYEKGHGTPGIYSMKRNKVLQEFIYEKGQGTPGIYQ